MIMMAKPAQVPDGFLQDDLAEGARAAAAACLRLLCAAGHLGPLHSKKVAMPLGVHQTLVTH